MRIQQDSAAIVRSLVEHGHPYHVPRRPRRYRYFDAVMLDILERHGEWAAPVLLALFRHNSAPRVLRFLDEAATPAENLVMVPSLPSRLLLQSARNIGLLGRI
jgi:lycopene beta-cyclase